MKAEDLKNELLSFFQQISIDMDAAFRPSIEPHGLTITQAKILFKIVHSEKPTVGSLCNVINASSGNASTACKNLERMGFIKRIRDKDDERVVNLQLTEMGLETVNAIDKDLDKKYSSFLSLKTEDEMEEIILGMKKIKVFLQELNDSQNQKRR